MNRCGKVEREREREDGGMKGQENRREHYDEYIFEVTTYNLVTRSGQATFFPCVEG